MAIRISKTALKVWLILIIFAVFCVIIGSYFGMAYGTEHANTFFQEYINESCICLM